MPLLSLLLAASSLASAATPGEAWPKTLTPHFLVRHQGAFPPSGLAMALEGMHGRLRMDLAMFSPWMAKERVTLLLYRDRESYLKGDIRPPEWSNGIALWEERLIATYVQADFDRMMEVVGHEMSHLLFESYWGKGRRRPPVWLNEGLAMLEESGLRGEPEKSGWHRSLGALSDGKTLALGRFAEITPSRDLDSGEVPHWYVQAYALTYFLYRKHGRLPFFNFCGALKEGADLSSALWRAYRLRPAQLESVWLAWLGERPREEARGLARAEPPAVQGRGGFKPKGFEPLYWHSLFEPERQ